MTCVKDLFSKRIKELRKAKNLTQEQFAELIGIDPRNIIKIENKQTFPRIQICHYLYTSLIYSMPPFDTGRQ